MATFHENLKTSFANFKAKYIKSSAAASGGTDLSMVTTGEKYTWNNKSDLALGTTATTAAKGNHTHTTSIATDSGTNQLTMAASTKYKLTAGGSTYIFTTPPNTTYSNVSTSAAGLAPKVTDTSKFLKGDGTWATPTNTTTGTTYAAGSVPANTTFGTNGSIKNVYDSLNNSKEGTLTFQDITSNCTWNSAITFIDKTAIRYGRVVRVFAEWQCRSDLNATTIVTMPFDSAMRNVGIAQLVNGSFQPYENGDVAGVGMYCWIEKNSPIITYYYKAYGFPDPGNYYVLMDMTFLIS